MYVSVGLENDMTALVLTFVCSRVSNAVSRFANASKWVHEIQAMTW